MKKYKVICPYCTKEADYVDSATYYSNGVSYGMMYLCRPCDAYVSVHKGSNTPMGTMANKTLRELRKKVHNIIDPIWQSGKLHRAQVYNRLSNHLGVDYYHTGLADERMCQRIISYANPKRRNNLYKLMGVEMEFEALNQRT